MSERKVVSRNTAIALATLSIILIAALSGVLLYFLVFNNESELKQPYLLNVGVYGSAENNGDEHVFHIRGWIANAGHQTAYKVKLHVECDYVMGAKAIDTYVQVGNGVILGRESSKVDIEVSYTNPGSIDLATSSAKITPEWSITP